MILWGIWQGNGKPNMTTFLKPMVTDLISLQGEEMVLRLNEENIICKVVLIVATMDLQARAAVLHMTQHNGKFSCVFCLEPGKVVKSCKGHCRCFPYSPVLNLRSDNMIMEDSKNAQKSKNLKTNINGFTGESVLNYLPNFSLKDNIVIDYMHGILLGITKKLLNFWFDSTYFDRPHFIGHKMKEIDVILKKITPPYLVIRLPRKLSNTLHHWKASELRSWLLYYSIPCLKGRLLDVYLTHYSLLVEATQTLLGEGITEDDLQRSDLLLHHFVKSADTLYGDNFLGLNVHNLLHIVPCVRKWGPLWAWSCFCFESFNGEIKKNIHGTGNVCRQIFWYLQAQKQIEKKASEPGDGAVKDFLREMTGHCSSSKTGLDAYQCLVKGKLNEGPAELPQVQEKKLFELSNKNSMKEFSKASKIVRNGFIMYSKACKKVQKRNSFTIRTSGNTVVEVHYYLMDNTSRHVYAVCTKLDTTCAVIERRVPHIRQARTVQDVELHIMKAEDLQQLVVNFKVNDQQFVAFIPNTIERD
ncbi:uncharacterized protein LOC117320344 [Pecten maximus]|nr:uncharacterized protein LOC117320344 [Pecten maximus]